MLSIVCVPGLLGLLGPTIYYLADILLPGLLGPQLSRVSCLCFCVGGTTSEQKQR